MQPIPSWMAQSFWLILCCCSTVGRAGFASGPPSLPHQQASPSPSECCQQANDPLAWFGQIPKAQQSSNGSHGGTTDRPLGASFGALLVEVAKVQMGKPYASRPWQGHPERLRYDFSGFDCVTLVEESLAIARCVVLQQPHVACFEAELTRIRYRQGQLSGYASRLHYFEDWMFDNGQRGLLEPLPSHWPWSHLVSSARFMTTHVTSYPALQQDLASLEQMQKIEQAIEQRPFPYWSVDELKDKQQWLQTGDIVGIVGSTPGLLVAHVGLIIQNEQRQPTFLHASTLQHKVVIQPQSLLQYLQANNKRRGIVVARAAAPRLVP